ncbi:MAG: hypothetical protein L6R38_003275 [Xanthoria sp. 2 TBL-2021]|nr:MAG: hypothetical protein L6R38_003275 [Xanthoria sp. 2 TBL-2021]
MVGMERQKPNAGGGAITIFKRGRAPISVEKAMDSGDTIKDEEQAGSVEGNQLRSEDSSGSDKGERQLLKDVQGYVRPGKLTALIGASGADKSTLLNTLVQCINFGVVTGDFLVDGWPLPKSF